MLYSHPAIAEVAVLGTPHQQWGEAVTAVVALTSGAALILDELREFARGKLAGYKIPSRLEFVDALPRNPAGKVLKYQLAAQLTASPQGELTCTPLTAAGVAPIPDARLVVTGAGCAGTFPGRRCARHRPPALPGMLRRARRPH